MNTLDITCELEEINNNKKSMTITGFIFCYNDNNYIISTHHGLPITKCYLTNDIKNTLRIYCNPIWNEILVLMPKYPIENIKITKKKKNRLVINKDELLLINNDEQVKLIYTTTTFMNLNSLKTNPYIPYLQADIVEGEIKRSYSGSPVFTKNNYLVGIFTKLNLSENSVYIIPVYFLIKTLVKKCNDSIFDISCENILKVNLQNIKDNLIKHKQMNLLMPLSTYFLLEGDTDKTELINDNFMDYTNINDCLYINNCTKLIKNKNTIEMTTRLYKLFQIFYSDIYFDINKLINENYDKKIYVKVNVKKPKEKSYYELNSRTDNFKIIISTQ
jgi:hypothetical protein